MRSYLKLEEARDAPSYVIQSKIYRISQRSQDAFEIKRQHRREELVRSTIEKKRDADGVFRLSKGF